MPMPLNMSLRSRNSPVATGSVIPGSPSPSSPPPQPAKNSLTNARNPSLSTPPP